MSSIVFILFTIYTGGDYSSRGVFTTLDDCLFEKEYNLRRKQLSFEGGYVCQAYEKKGD